ncbi:MAG: ABC transporter permease [Gemmatimonadota bacterium]
MRGLGLSLLRGVVVVAGVVTLTFLLLHVAPGDPIRYYLGPTASAEQIAGVKEALGLGRSLSVQYVDWLGRALRGDFGTSITTGRPAFRMLMEAWPATLLLVGLSTVLGHLIGLAIGTWQALTRRTVVDAGLTIGTVALYAMPSYWLGLVLTLVFSFQLRWLPAFGARGLDADFLSPSMQWVDRLSHLALPLLTLTLIGIGAVARYARGSLRDLRSAPFLVVARSKGLGPVRVTVRHHLRNGLTPVLTMLGLSLPALFSGAVFVEAIFAWPGVGLVLVQAVKARDYPVVMAATTISAMLVVIANLFTEWMLRRIDPRIGASRA